MEQQEANALTFFGFPATSAWTPALAQLVASLQNQGMTLTAGEEPIDEAPAALPQSALERLYRRLDSRLFAASNTEPMPAVALRICPEAPGSAAVAWDLPTARRVAQQLGQSCITLDLGPVPPWHIEEAVRAALGAAGGTMPLRLLEVTPQGRLRTLLSAECRIEHRSLSRSVAYVSAKLPELVVAAVRRLAPSAGAGAEGDEAVAASRNAADAPLTAMTQLSRLVGASVDRLLWREQWSIAVFHGAPSSRGSAWAQARVLRAPRDRLWADPFIEVQAERVLLYFEDMPFATERGQISVLEMNRELQPLGKPRPVLQLPYHLSYPFLWFEDGRCFMIPESSANRSLDLYERVGDIDRFEHRATLISGLRLADASIVRHAGRLWMFATGGAPGANLDDALHIFFADRIEGPWRAHGRNPVKVNAACTRPAGAMWVENDHIHRVVQDCSRVYGGATRCMRVDVLDEQQFSESEIRAWPVGQAMAHRRWHTLNRSQGYSAVDWLQRRFRPGST